MSVFSHGQHEADNSGRSQTRWVAGGGGDGKGGPNGLVEELAEDAWFGLLVAERLTACLRGTLVLPQAIEGGHETAGALGGRDGAG